MIFLWLISCTTLILLNLSSALGENCNGCIEGFYWREYNGIVPKDALPGGLDGTGNITYIGQTLHDDLLIPGEIRPAERNAAYEIFQMEFTQSENVKILCSQSKEEFEWIKLCNNRSKDLNCTNLIKGGYEIGNPVYIGRIPTMGETVVGKVSVSEEYAELRISPHCGREFKFNSFEILHHDPNAASKREKTAPHKPTTFESGSSSNEENIGKTMDENLESKGAVKVINVEINLPANKIATGIATFCIIQYLILTIFCSVIYITFCLFSRLPQIY